MSLIRVVFVRVVVWEGRSARGAPIPSCEAATFEDPLEGES